MFSRSKPISGTFILCGEFRITLYRFIICKVSNGIISFNDHTFVIKIYEVSIGSFKTWFFKNIPGSYCNNYDYCNRNKNYFFHIDSFTQRNYRLKSMYVGEFTEIQDSINDP